MELKSLIGKVNETTRGALEAAAGLCLSRTNYDIEIEHYLLKLMDIHGHNVHPRRSMGALPPIAVQQLGDDPVRV